jgi:hypothetical protein
VLSGLMGVPTALPAWYQWQGVCVRVQRGWWDGRRYTDVRARQ